MDGKKKSREREGEKRWCVGVGVGVGVGVYLDSQRRTNARTYERTNGRLEGGGRKGGGRMEDMREGKVKTRETVERNAKKKDFRNHHPFLRHTSRHLPRKTLVYQDRP